MRKKASRSSRLSSDRNWEIFQGGASIFGYCHQMLSDGTLVFNYSLIIDGEEVPEDPAWNAMESEIRPGIAEDEQNGLGDQIAYLTIGPAQALSLFREGYIKPSHLKNSTEYEDKIIIADISICDHKLALIIVDDFDGSYTTDATGKELL